MARELHDIMPPKECVHRGNKTNVMLAGRPWLAERFAAAATLRDRADAGGKIYCMHECQRHPTRLGSLTPLAQACFLCQKWFTLAAWYVLHPDHMPQLLRDEDLRSLTDFGMEAAVYARLNQPLTPPAPWRCSTKFAVEWWDL